MKRKIMSFLLNIAQKLLNKLYEKEGLTDRVLDSQIKINRLRCKSNISDKKNAIYKNFVQ